ncbi:MAG TPA: methyltransferase domain-containing protein [Jiangellaceae bacterium]
MAACCEPQGYDRIFSTRTARRAAKRYRKSGLTWAPRRTAELYRAGVITGQTVLEIGGGIGDLQIELLGAGVERAMSVELSPNYEQVADGLLGDAGLAGRSERLVGDFATVPGLAQPADVVVLHSVVCCYPDPARLLEPAARATRRHLVISYPRESWWLRVWGAVENLYPWMRGSDARFIVHPEPNIVRPIERAGLRRFHTEHNWVDHLAVFTREQ